MYAYNPNDGSYSCVRHLPALGAVLPPSAFAQQEYTSLGKEEGLVSGIVSDVLEDCGD